MGGGTLPPFPSLAAVKADIPLLNGLMKEYDETERMISADRTGATPEPLLMYSRLQNLYLFSMLCVTTDVPYAIIREVSAALKLFLLLVEYKSLIPVIKEVGFYGVPIDDLGVHRLRSIARSRMVELWLRDDVNATAGALKVIGQMVEEHKRELISKGSPHVQKPWRDQLPVYAQLADVLVFGNEFNKRTRYLLEQLLECARDQSATNFESTKELREDVVLSCRIHMSLVLSQLCGAENEAKAKQHTSWVVSQVRDRPYMREMLSGYVLREELPVEHPVATALGPAWFANASSSRSPETRSWWMPSGSGSSSSACAQCGAQKGSVGEELLRCSRCKDAYYCSKDCQKVAWKSHKSICRSAS
ncbi:hypothetical protein EIP91_005691 [Steccherinum ochraceum]|uniref:MYND-type domain-containing protein n=1 Tax=Steccherinum ochraceum TaxID=92696 RepID=A0A4R0R6U4_9APHY|nr:hypothetical protein EIP91_005691 [Steccherinum ochraceum]